jgi:hypothetical protein
MQTDWSPMRTLVALLLMTTCAMAQPVETCTGRVTTHITTPDDEYYGKGVKLLMVGNCPIESDVNTKRGPMKSYCHVKGIEEGDGRVSIITSVTRIK